MRRSIRLVFSLILIALTGCAICGDTVVSARFDKAGWNPADFILVKSPRWEHVGTWVQEDTCIRNAVPPNVTERELQGKRAAETYTSMVYRERIRGDFTVKASVAFAHRMAPLIVLAPELGTSRTGKHEYREHYEIVLFDKGVNVWHHFYNENKPSWKKVIFVQFALQKNTSYVLTVQRKGKSLNINVDGHDFDVLLDASPEDVYVGITGCEGVNWFYNFEIKQ